MIYDVAIIGGGVIGCAIARALSKYKLNTVVLEKEGDVAEGISKANSGVLHAGFNIKPNTLKAQLNVQGLNYFPTLAHELDVPYKLCKKLVVAKNKAELSYIEKLLAQGKANQCEGLSIIGKDKINKLQPGITAEYALYSEKTAIISPYEFTIALAENAHKNGVHFEFYATVHAITPNKPAGFTLHLKDGRTFFANLVINAAGVDAESIMALLEKPKEKTYPARGEYFILDCRNNDQLKMAVYPVPPIDGRGLGIHLTPTINGNILIGPSAEYVEDRYDVQNTQSVMKTLLEEAYGLMPGLRDIPIIRSYAGMRPKLFHPESGKTFVDFMIEPLKDYPHFINLMGIESPGLTSAPAIADYVLNTFISKLLPLQPNEKFNPYRTGIARTKFMTPTQVANLITRDKNYGEIVCRCEQVTKAEILKAIHNPLGTKTLNAIKKRTHAMMGRCQSGFCLPKICKILMEEGISPNEIVLNAQGKAFLKSKHA